MDMNKTHKVLKAKRSRGPPGGGKTSEKDTAMKVVYISTPMKVKTSASKFRAIVQELTGRESDVVGIMESYGGRDTWILSDHHRRRHQQQQQRHDHDGVFPSLSQQEDPDRRRASPASSSEELIDDSFNGVLRGQYEGFGAFDNSSTLLYDQFCYQLDVLGSY